MIINYPTGLYSNLPRAPADTASVTYTISNRQPPRSNQLFPYLPPGVAFKPKPPWILPVDIRRAYLGTLAYTAISASATTMTTNITQFDVGQILDFDDPTLPAPSAALLIAGTESSIQHDNTVLDYSSMGLTGAEQLAIALAGADTFRTKQTALSGAREQYLTIQCEIAENQKLLTGTSRAIASLSLIQDNESINKIIDELQSKLVTLTTQRDLLISKANTTSELAIQLQTELLTLSQVVK